MTPLKRTFFFSEIYTELPEAGFLPVLAFCSLTENRPQPLISHEPNSSLQSEAVISDNIT